ncbi:glycosyltransferase family 2 protein [Agrobacterium tumefaciens]|nr:glycosyltransferase family 2 protein [Agrobacterium tumefaciens]
MAIGHKMATWGVRKIRRFPAREIAKTAGSFGAIAGIVYRAVDWRGKLSDFIADPQSAILGLLPRDVLLPLLRRSGGPLVTVVVATRNNAETIVSSLQSLTRQTHSHIEIIVVDDASSDNSCDLIRAIAKSDERVNLLSNRRQMGTGYSRNLGLLAAKGEYVTFQDGDDISLPTRISAQLSVFSKFQGKVLSLCNYVRVDTHGDSLEINDRRVMKCIISMMFPRKEILERVGFFMDGTVSEDSDFYERIKIAFGADCETLVFRTLYHALFRQNSSFFDQMEIKKIERGRISFNAPAKVSSARERVNARHAMMREGKISYRVGFDPSFSKQASELADQI